MKFQFLIACLVLLAITFSVEAQPIEKRGLLKGVTNTLKKVTKLLFHGRGTFFSPAREGGSQGACGPFSNDDSQIVAMNREQYGDLNKKSHWCGKRLKICYDKKCTVATVTDACPGCDHGCLDLTPAVWQQLESDTSKGVLPISWGELEDGDEGNDESDDEDNDDEST